jgi:hypothetical protein
LIEAGGPEMSRRELSRRVCEELDWRTPEGRLQQMSCRKALLELERRGVINLPEAKRGYEFEEKRRKDREGEDLSELAEVECSLKELGGVEVIAVSSRTRRR